MKQQSQNPKTFLQHQIITIACFVSVESQSAVDSPWSTMLEGWVETGAGHDDHDAEHAEPEHGDDGHDEHGNYRLLNLYTWSRLPVHFLMNSF